MKRGQHPILDPGLRVHAKALRRVGPDGGKAGTEERGGVVRAGSGHLEWADALMCSPCLHPLGLADRNDTPEL